MADLAWRRGRALAPILVLAAIVLLAALAFNLRNLDPGTEELPPPPVTEESPDVVAQEGAGAGLRAFFSMFIAILVLSVFVGGLLLYARGVKIWKLFSPWELLGYGAAVLFILFALLFWDSIQTGVQNFVVWVSTGGNPPDAPGTGTGDAPPGALPTGGAPSSLLMFAILAISALYVLVFSVYFLPRLYRVVTYEAPDVGRSKRELAKAVRTAIRDLEAGEDFRAAVLRCYQTMVLLFESRGMRQEPHETVREWESHALAGMGLSASGIAELTSLFEEARYSTHPIGERERDRAIASLASVRAQLEGGA